jgi:superfamily II DNA/RNA helicase
MAAAFQLSPSSSTTSPLARRFQPRHHSLPRLQSSTSNDAAAESESFTSLYQDQLPPWLLARTEALGFETPTPVQRAALGPILQVRRRLVNMIGI